MILLHKCCIPVLSIEFDEKSAAFSPAHLAFMNCAKNTYRRAQQKETPSVECTDTFDKKEMCSRNLFDAFDKKKTCAISLSDAFDKKKPLL